MSLNKIVPNQHWQSPAGLENPFARAKQEWDIRMGSALVRERQWRRLSVALLATVLAALGGLVFLGSRAKAVPYVITVDRNGTPAYQGMIADDPSKRQVRPVEVRAHIARWLDDVRSISTDSAIRAKGWIEAKHFSTPAAYAQLKAFVESTNPGRIAATQRVTVEVNAIVQTDPERWQVDWTETTWDHQGNQLSQAPWRASLRVLHRPSTALEELPINPLGLLVDEFSWTRVH